LTCAAGQEKFIISIYTLPLFLLDEFPQKLQKKNGCPSGEVRRAGFGSAHDWWIACRHVFQRSKLFLFDPPAGGS